MGNNFLLTSDTTCKTRAFFPDQGLWVRQEIETVTMINMNQRHPSTPLSHPREHFSVLLPFPVPSLEGAKMTRGEGGAPLQ